MKQDFETIKSLEFDKDELEKFADFFNIIHHSRGRIRLRASEKLVSLLLKGGTQRLEALLESAKALPMIKSVKINKLIASVTIEYDANAFKSELWELWLVKKDGEAVFEHLQKMIKAL